MLCGVDCNIVILYSVEGPAMAMTSVTLLSTTITLSSTVTTLSLTLATRSSTLATRSSTPATLLSMALTVSATPSTFLSTATSSTYFVSHFIPRSGFCLDPGSGHVWVQGCPPSRARLSNGSDLCYYFATGMSYAASRVLVHVTRQFLLLLHIFKVLGIWVPDVLSIKERSRTWEKWRSC